MILRPMNQARHERPCETHLCNGRRPHAEHRPSRVGARCATSPLSPIPNRSNSRCAPELEDFYVLSPYVICRAGKYEMLVRLVNRDADPSKKVSRIHYATSRDGIRFDVEQEVIAPGGADEPDGAGREDPTYGPVTEIPTRYFIQATTRRVNVLRCLPLSVTRWSRCKRPAGS